MQIYTENKTGKILGLNALRFLGALSVIFLHLGSMNWFEARGLSEYHPLFSGKTGVYLFYVISGFLITALAVDEIRKTERFDFKKFFARRALRLFPLYYLAIACIGLLHILGLTSVDPTSWIYALTYSYNFVPLDAYNGLLGSFHTLGTEEQFYMAYGLLLCLIFSGIAPQRYLPAKYISLAVILIMCVTANQTLRPYFANFEVTHFVRRWSFFAMDPIGIGCLAALFYKSKWVESFVKTVKNRETILVATHLSLCAIFLWAYIGYAFHGSVTLLSIGFSCLLLDLSLFRQTLTARVLENRVFAYLGTISYGLYVWQAVINGTGSNARWIESPYISTALVFIVSVVSYELYEKRFLELKKNYRPERTEPSEKGLPSLTQPQPKPVSTAI